MSEQLGEPCREDWVAESFRGNEQHIEQVVIECLKDRVPLVDVGAVDAFGPEACFTRSGHLISHECEQGGDDECGSAASFSQRGGCGPVNGAFAPAGGLDNENSSDRSENGFDCGELVGTRNGLRSS